MDQERRYFSPGYNNSSTAGVNNNTEPGCKYNLSFGTYIGLTATLGLIGVWIVIANSMIISAPRVNKRLRKKTYMFVSSLAAVDLTAGLLLNTGWLMGIFDVFSCRLYLSVKTNTYCAFIQAFFMFSLFCSVCNLFLIALDRYIALVYPLKYDVILTRTRCRILIACVWMFAASSSLVNLFWNNPKADGELRCNAKDISPELQHYVIGLSLWLICVAMFFMYTMIYKTIRTRYTCREFNIRNNQKVQSDIKAAKMLFITYTVFFVCVSPLGVCLHLLMESIVTMHVVYYPFCLAYLNSGMNFFIYSARNKQYQDAFRKMLKCCNCFKFKKAKPETESSTSSGTKRPSVLSTPTTSSHL